MTTRVVWLCPDCDMPVNFTADVERLGPGEYKVRAAEHIHAHRVQHKP